MNAVVNTSSANGVSRGVIFIRMMILLVAVAALLSPIYVALRGSAFLNQPPPPYWQMNAGTPPVVGNAGSGHKPASFGGC